MKVKFIQEQGYGCGMYAVANVINEESFISPERLEASKKGNTLYQLNKWLEEDGKDYITEPLYMNLVTQIAPLPPKGFRLDPEEGNLFPFLLEIGKGEKNHLIGCHSDNAGNITVMDSLKEDIFITDWDNLLSGAMYNIVVGIYGFTKKEPDGGWMFLK